jgi:hypothetical protein
MDADHPQGRCSAGGRTPQERRAIGGLQRPIGRPAAARPSSGALTAAFVVPLPDELDGAAVVPGAADDALLLEIGEVRLWTVASEFKLKARPDLFNVGA